MTDEELQWLREQLKAAALEAGVEGEGEGEEDWQDPSGGELSALLEAVEDGDAARVTEVLKAFKADINTPGPDGDTALHLACLYGHEDCVRALLAGGADANAVNKEDGSTALHDAAAGGYLEICEIILEKGNAKKLISRFDEDGESALHTAARGNHLDVVKFLIARGADPNAQNGYGNKPVDEADEQPVIDYLKSL
ncbi:hypothetical protein CHLRE_06g283300v5 [Chlamydomonas reinhardtii]|uniref:Uncharacterized protein n=1 Tax=Chlamydomonas reinhardtii TaxID=3055 RepID=A0A2K3DPS7_CHLRE|nr:uncharacterized protein CHLRE_06g283300v5 [Chlamydomonas reinhardtii]PNW82545.1 hypothetical protein CHLRE_06g283300v5 [Chlamydomonas reinhardtii]